MDRRIGNTKGRKVPYEDIRAYDPLVGTKTDRAKIAALAAGVSLHTARLALYPEEHAKLLADRRARKLDPRQRIMKSIGVISSVQKRKAEGRFIRHSGGRSSLFKGGRQRGIAEGFVANEDRRTPKGVIREIIRLRLLNVKIRKKAPMLDASKVADRIIADPRCYLTGQVIDLFNDIWNLDHIVPLARGGTHSEDNLALAYEAVNKAKGDLTVPEFHELCAKVLRHAGYRVELTTDSV